jgi:hypothetical protein
MPIFDMPVCGGCSTCEIARSFHHRGETCDLPILIGKMTCPRPEIGKPIPTGKLAGWKIDKQKYNKMLDEYYDFYGWDRQTSYPNRKTLVDLGLERVAEDLAKIGKLG